MTENDHITSALLTEVTIIIVELRRLCGPTVLGISEENGDSTPDAVGLGIGVERGNGGVDSVVKLWEISPVFTSRFS